MKNRAQIRKNHLDIANNIRYGIIYFLYYHTIENNVIQWKI